MRSKPPHLILSFRQSLGVYWSDIAQRCSCSEPKMRHSRRFKICSHSMAYLFRNRASFDFAESIAPSFNACGCSLNRNSIYRQDRHPFPHPRRTHRPKAGNSVIFEAQFKFGSSAMEAALRFQTAPGGGLYGAVWLRSAGCSACGSRPRLGLNLRRSKASQPQRGDPR